MKRHFRAERSSLLAKITKCGDPILIWLFCLNSCTKALPDELLNALIKLEGVTDKVISCLSVTDLWPQCDELGPPCGPCTARQTDCLYSQTNEIDKTSTANRGLDTSNAVTSTQPGPNNGHQTNLLDLELMHQWSTSTYKSMCGTVEKEHPTWRNTLVREGFKYPFLLHGLLALASLEIVAEGNRSNQGDYVGAGLEYHERALKSFRHELADITPEKEQAILAFSLVTMVLSLALPQFTASLDEPQSMIDNMVTHFGLILGVNIITRQHWDSLRRAPILQNVPWEQAQIEELEAGLQSAMTRLNDLNETKHNPAVEQSRASKLRNITYHAACRKAIFYLEEIFRRCEHPYEKGYALAWMNWAGKDYVTAVENADPVAMLILMHFGLLADKCSDDVWWARSLGKSLVNETTEVLAAETDAVLRTSVSWVRDQLFG